MISQKMLARIASFASAENKFHSTDPSTVPWRIIFLKWPSMVFPSKNLSELSRHEFRHLEVWLCFWSFLCTKSALLSFWETQKVQRAFYYEMQAHGSETWSRWIVLFFRVAMVCSSCLHPARRLRRLFVGGRSVDLRWAQCRLSFSRRRVLERRLASRVLFSLYLLFPSLSSLTVRGSIVALRVYCSSLARFAWKKNKARHGDGWSEGCRTPKSGRTLKSGQTL